MFGDILGEEGTVGFWMWLQGSYYINELEKLVENIPFWS